MGKNVHLIFFPEHTETSLNVLFCPTYSYNLKKISKLNIFGVVVYCIVEPEHVWTFEKYILN